MATYGLDDGNGNCITTGLQEHLARRTAQRMANERGVALYLYALAEGDGEPGASEEIAPEPPMVVAGRMETTTRRLVVVEVDGPRWQVRDVTHSTEGRVLGNPLASLEGAMREAYQALLGVHLIEATPRRAATAAELAGDAYLSGNERALGMGPEEG